MIVMAALACSCLLQIGFWQPARERALQTHQNHAPTRQCLMPFLCFAVFEEVCARGELADRFFDLIETDVNEFRLHVDRVDASFGEFAVSRSVTLPRWRRLPVILLRACGMAAGRSRVVCRRAAAG